MNPFISTNLKQGHVSFQMFTNHGRDIGYDPHLQNQDEEGMPCVRKCSVHIQVSRLFRERLPMVPQNNQWESETEKRQDYHVS